MMSTPKDLGFYFPAEWTKHESTWLSYPHNENSWPGKIDTIFPYYNTFIKELSMVERVNININDHNQQTKIENELRLLGANMQNIVFHLFKTNDAWIRDHGPAFIVNDKTKQKAIVNWQYNAWGGKYPYNLDNLIPSLIAKHEGLKVFNADIVMEGGSVDFNGQNDVLTTKSCLLNKNRNPHLTQSKIEDYLRNYYGVETIHWLEEGLQGDDTDGHIDDLSRFVNPDTIVTMVSQNKSSEDYSVLEKNLKILKTLRLNNGKQATIVEIPLPKEVIYDGQKLPASYANFYIANDIVIVPVYNCSNDEVDLKMLQDCFADRKIIAIDSTEIIWGLGSFHCLSQQEPLVK